MNSPISEPPLSKSEEPATSSPNVEQLADELAMRWRSGERPLVEEYFASHPVLLECPEWALELIAEEMRLRQDNGLELDVRDYERRFPRWRKQILALLRCHALLSPALAEPRFPPAGEALGDFLLVRELGRGAHGRVFLARQSSLAGRLVVLKLCPLLGDEYLSLSRLQHTHVVPLYSVHEFSERGLLGLCQPYFGGATLGELLEDLRDVTPAQRSGRDLVRVLRGRCDRSGTNAGQPKAATRELSFLEGRSWVEAVCWLGACLADALQHAHDRGLLHLDVKPANVLLAGDGQPMLLDFHLARPPLPSGASPTFGVGGTPGYVAPEQEAALAAVRAGAAIPAALDARTDVYALGTLLYEALSGETPPPVAPGATLQRQNRKVSVGLADLLSRCLAPNGRRYESAAQLAADLRRHLADLPLRGVANRSPRECWRKWRRRRPRILPFLGFLLAAVVAVGLWGLQTARSARLAEAELLKGEALLRDDRHAEALEAFRSGGALASDVPFVGGLRTRLRQGEREAERGCVVAHLRALCEKLRPLYGAELLTSEQAVRLEADCRALWGKRDEILQRLAGADARDGERVKTELLDLAVLRADLLVRSARGKQVAFAHEQALQLLAEAEEFSGPRLVLCQEIASHARALGRPAPAYPAALADSRSLSAWERYALGRAALNAGDARAAIDHLDQALALEPNALWARFARGIAASRLGKHEEALAAFSGCVALAPRSAPCAYSRGRAFMELGQAEPALRDFELACGLDSDLRVAVLARADALRRLRRFDEALAVLNDTSERGEASTAVCICRAVIQLDKGERAAAESILREALRSDPNDEQARQLLRKLCPER